jgi:Matrixin
MEHATAVTIPTIVHLMLADDSLKPEHKKEVMKTKEFFPKVLASADNKKSVNAIWKRAAVQFELVPDGIDIVPYHLKDFGAEPGVGSEEAKFECSEQPTEEEQRRFRALQDKFGSKGFQGLQVFVLARMASENGCPGRGGCAMSQPDGVTGSAWLDAPAVMDDSVGFFLPMAHEIGHFLSLHHVQVPMSLMNPDLNSQGRVLSDDEVKTAHRRAVEVMKKQ